MYIANATYKFHLECLLSVDCLIVKQYGEKKKNCLDFYIDLNNSLSSVTCIMTSLLCSLFSIKA